MISTAAASVLLGTAGGGPALAQNASAETKVSRTPAEQLDALLLRSERTARMLEAMSTPRPGERLCFRHSSIR
jgi:hypothetical protein